MSTPVNDTPGNDTPMGLDFEALRSEIHVVPVLLESAPGEAAWSLLDSDEAARARAFTAPRAQAAFVHCRALLRSLLGACLDQPPSSLVFAYNDFGKPSLAAHSDFCFNVSHSGGVALLAFAAGAPIGVDIERLRPMHRALALAERFFSQQESFALRSLAAGAIDTAFLSCWTRKEAAVKALGINLDGQLGWFSVPVEPMPAPVSIAVSGLQLTLHSLPLAPHAIGALAYAGPPRPVRIEAWRHASRT